MSQSLPVTGNTEHTVPENRAFYPALDGLRAIAFFMVFVYHYFKTPWGWAGVNVFFVLSGFLITGILFDTRQDAHRVRNFYVRRTLRIFPLYYGIFLVLLILAPLVHWQWTWHWLVWPAYLGNFVGFVHPYGPGSATQSLADFALATGHPSSYTPFSMGHFWTLCVEEQFYLVWPWIVFWVRDRRKLLMICAASIPICLALRFVADHQLPTWMLQHEVVAHATPFRVDDLLLGGMIALLLRGPNAAKMMRWSKPAAVAAVGALILWFAVTPAHELRLHPYPYPVNVLSLGFTCISVLSGLVILVALDPRNWLSRILRVYPLRWVGRISYGAYVFHDIFHTAYDDIGNRICLRLQWQHDPISRLLCAQPGRLTALIALGATLLLAWLSFKLYESPFLNLKERWTSR